jgi:hypothetical protein
LYTGHDAIQYPKRHQPLLWYIPSEHGTSSSPSPTNKKNFPQGLYVVCERTQCVISVAADILAVCHLGHAQVEKEPLHVWLLVRYHLHELELTSGLWLVRVRSFIVVEAYGWIPHNSSFDFLDKARDKLGQIHF